MDSLGSCLCFHDQAVLWAKVEGEEEGRGKREEGRGKRRGTGLLARTPEWIPLAAADARTQAVGGTGLLARTPEWVSFATADARTTGPWVVRASRPVPQNGSPLQLLMPARPGRVVNEG